MTSWTDAPLVAVDLEGSGAQDHQDEAILEIAVVPIAGGRPLLADTYSTLINPGRPIPRRPWISPGLTSKILASAPSLPEVTPELVARINGKILVGHNVRVDYRLLRRRCPEVRPQSLIDTLRLARHVSPSATGNGLGALLDRHELTAEVTSLVPDSQPHRALWDTVGTALLLPALIKGLPGDPAITELLRIAGLPAEASGNEHAVSPGTGQGSLFDP